MLSQSALLYGIVLPFALAAAILLVAWQPWRRARRTPAHWGGPLAAGVAFATAFAALEGPAHVIKPASAIMWLFYVAVGFTLLGVIDATERLPGVIRVIMVFAGAAGGAAILLRFNFVNETWNAPHGALWLGAIATVALFWWASFEQSAVDGGLMAPLAMGAVIGVGAMIVAVLVEQTTGQAMGAMAIVFAISVPLIAWSGRASLARGTAVAMSGIGVCALAGAYFISSLPMQYVLLVALSPAMLWVGRIPAIRRLRPWIRTAILLVLLLIPLGIAAGLAVVQAQHDATLGSDPYTISGFLHPFHVAFIWSN